jgi:hypothetical protein
VEVMRGMSDNPWMLTLLVLCLAICILLIVRA